MTRQHWWVVAILAVLAVGGTAIAAVATYVPGEPATSNAPVTSDDHTESPAPGGEPEVAEELTGRVEVGGTVTALSSGTDDGFYLLRVIGEGYLPISVPASIPDAVLARGVVIAVPAGFTAPSDTAELFAALAKLAEQSGEPLSVVALL